MTIELQSAALLEKCKSDRSCIHGVIERGFAGRRRYQVFAFDKGFLFLEIGKDRAEKGKTGAFVGRVLGGQVGAFIGSEIEESFRDDYEAPDHNFAMQSNDELLAMARKNKKSFVAPYEDIQWAKLEKTGGFAKVFGGNKNIGQISLKEKTLGKLCLEISHWESMIAAIEVFPKRLGDRAKVRIRLDESRCEFVTTPG